MILKNLFVSCCLLVTFSALNADKEIKTNVSHVVSEKSKKGAYAVLDFEKIIEASKLYRNANKKLERMASEYKAEWETKGKKLDADLSDLNEKIANKEDQLESLKSKKAKVASVAERNEIEAKIKSVEAELVSLKKKLNDLANKVGAFNKEVNIKENELKSIGESTIRQIRDKLQEKAKSILKQKGYVMILPLGIAVIAYDESIVDDVTDAIITEMNADE
ncbi:MAG: OmpH family outer membrane protein [Alphaproteobacteria bacterium]|nr:MAG: OmpH family outer membrane protein [Alphaproteobacteria bacterium]